MNAAVVPRGIAVRIVVALSMLATGVLGVAVSRAATPAPPTISPPRPGYAWTGGPLVASSGTGASECSDGATCDERAVALQVPAAYWRSHPGGITVRIAWADPTEELDLYVLDPAGRTIASSDYGGRTAAFQQVYLDAPAPGTYHILVAAAVADETTYRGSVRLTSRAVADAVTRPDTMAFTQALVDPQVLVSEPGLSVDRAGEIFVTAPLAPGLGSYAWRSRDGGRTFAALPGKGPTAPADVTRSSCGPVSGGADSDIVKDRTGRVYFAALEAAQIEIGYSTDDGDTWQCNALAASSPEDDRPWLAAAPGADGTGPAIDAYLLYVDLLLGQEPVGQQAKPIRLHLDVTRDGGATWAAAGTFGAGTVPVPGPIFTAADGMLYAVYSADDGVWLARSADGGRSFSQHLVSQRPGDPSNSWVSGDVDGRGVVHVAWVDGGGWDALYTSSADRGDHWRAPLRVSAPDQTALLPWLSAAGNGDVAIAWYGAEGRFVPDVAPALTPWQPWVARATDADGPMPHFERAPLSDAPVHYGPVTTAPGGHSFLGDFFTVAHGPDGTLYASFVDQGRQQQQPAVDTAGAPRPFAVVARQLRGLGMSPAVQRSAAVVQEGRWDVNVAGAVVDPGTLGAYDLASLPVVQRVGNTLRVSVQVVDGRAVNAAPSAGALGATDAYWIIRWETGRRVDYAGLHVDAAGQAEWLAGNQPVAVLAPPSFDERYASYPAAIPATGDVDARSGIISVDVSVTALGLRPGDLIRDAQAFALGGSTPQRTFATLLDLYDATPAVTLRLR